MIICHLCLSGTYNEGWNYQENILPKYHAKMGLDVYQIVTPYMWKGAAAVRSKPERYINENGVHVIRMHSRNDWLFRGRFDRYPGLKKELESIHPDILFVHDCQFVDVKTVVAYIKKHKKMRVYADNHADFSNSATNWLSKNILHKIIWKHYAQMLYPYVRRFYGVLPARVDFLVNVYGLPKEKCGLLVMGADDELVEKNGREESRKRLNKELGLEPDDFVVMTGGKIDQWKKQTLLLMQAVQKIRDRKVKLVVFGSVAEGLKQKVSSLADNKRVYYIGWIDAKESYRYFAAADLAVFPGRHSVFWEQAAGQGIPMVCKEWEGTHHVDAGGNVKFVNSDSVRELKDAVTDIASHPEIYRAMKQAAVEKGMKAFSYRDIAGRCIED